MEARVGHFSVPGLAEVRAEPILNPVSKSSHRARVTLPHGFEYTRGGVRQQRDQDAGTRGVRMAARTCPLRAAAPDAQRAGPLAEDLPMSSASPLERLLRRDRLAVIAALSAVIVACWAYVLAGAGTGMSPFAMTAITHAPGGTAHTGGDMPGTGRTGHARDGHGRGCGRRHVGDGDRGDGAGRLDSRLRRPDVLHVVDHDDGDDAAKRRAHDPPVRPDQPQAARQGGALRTNRHVRCRLCPGLGSLQPGRGLRAMGPGAERLSVIDDGEHQRDTLAPAC